MAISDEFFLVAFTLTFIYLVLYKKHKLFGNIAFIATSITLMSYSTDTITSAIGFILLMGSIINLFWDLLYKTFPKWAQA